MLLIIEIGMLIAGVWAIATARLPSWLLGGSKYEYEGRGVRWLGLILVLPLPVAFIGGVVLGLLFGEQGTGYAFILEIAIVVVVLVAAIIVGRFIRQPATVSAGEATTAEVPDVEATIAHKARGSLIYALLSVLGPVAIVACPLAYVRSNQALRLIEQHQVGQKHRGTAKAARILAAVIFLGWTALIVFWLVLLVVHL